MNSGVKTQTLRIRGMTCVNCQNKIAKKLRGAVGVQSATVNFSAGTAQVTFDTQIVSEQDLSAIIEKLGYEVLANRPPAIDSNHIIGAIAIIAVLYMLISHSGLRNFANAFPLAEEGMGYVMLLVIGLITSVHCLGMCGGINLSQCIPAAAQDSDDGSKTAALRPSFLYNGGRVLAYTLIGGIVGALGSVISLSGGFKGVIQLIAGVFMVIMGLSMLGIFPWLRRFVPRMPQVFARRIDAEKSKSNSPFIVGLFNGLMPCGPLQAMQLYALSTGSVTRGALSMLVFSLGTVPLMFGMGALSSVLSKKFTQKVMAAGAVLVVVLGLTMFSQGWSLSGLSLSGLMAAEQSTGQLEKPPAEIVNGVQIVRSTLSARGYPAITVQAGVPVRWTINAPNGSITGCNNRMIIPEYGIEYRFQPGDNIVEFTPAKTGKFPYSCWMGMVRSSITVVNA
ncbi:MAG: sulfite exporter TauE/SafE family protein [Peptococcaceae bacterium]|jgi:sulfite exporter TauE/SafE/copper chaperone CopZ|nr:sulfite exporter TauE/SafE family protein [Peptococcaceae bacterium]